MRPQFFPWLFDDKVAWEKSLADPRYSYELTIDHFMSLYVAERKGEASIQGSASRFTPMLQTAPVPIIPESSNLFSSPISAPLSNIAPVQVAAAPPEESKREEGILSQDEIDALLSGS